MSWKVSKNGDITMTRGDTPRFKININACDESGQIGPYTPKDSDEIVFALKSSRDDDCPLLTKVIPNDTMLLAFAENDTNSLAFGMYLYEISLNNGAYHDTFIENKRLTLTTELY